MPRSVERSRGLAKLQGWFFDQLQPGSIRGAGPVQGTRWLSARSRVEIYAGMYRARLVDALAQDFPRLFAALGSRRFERIALAYLRSCPSRRPTIQDVGARLPHFLGKQLAGGKLVRFPFVADLARLEKAGSEVYVCAADPGAQSLRLTASSLEKVPPRSWASLRFRVTATLRIVRLGFRFPRGRKPVRGRTAYRIYRRGLDVFEAPMDVAEARALSLVARGRSFGEVCLALGDAAKAATALATWVDEGLLLGVNGLR